MASADSTSSAAARTGRRRNPDSAPESPPRPSRRVDDEVRLQRGAVDDDSTHPTTRGQHAVDVRLPAVFDVFRDTTPLVEGLSIDEAFLEVGGLRRIRGLPSSIAEQLRHDVRTKVGLPISVGVARTKYLAKVASAVSKPEGLLVVP